MKPPINTSERTAEQYLRRIALSPKARLFGRLRAIDRLAADYGAWVTPNTVEDGVPGVLVRGRRFVFLRRALLALRSSPKCRELMRAQIDERLLVLTTGVPNDEKVVWVQQPRTVSPHAQQPTATSPGRIDFAEVARQALAEFNKEEA